MAAVSIKPERQDLRGGKATEASWMMPTREISVLTESINSAVPRACEKLVKRHALDQVRSRAMKPCPGIALVN